MDGFIRVRALAQQQMKAGGFNHASGLDAPVPMGEQRVAVRIEKIGGTEAAQICGKTGHDGKPHLDRR